MIDKLVQELKDVTLEPKGFIVILAGKDRVANQSATVTLWNFDSLTYEAAAALLYELKQLEHQLITLKWEGEEEKG